MAEQDRELIFRILQESDDDDDDEIDKILLENITKKGLTGKSNKIDISKGSKKDWFTFLMINCFMIVI